MEQIEFLEKALKLKPDDEGTQLLLFQAYFNHKEGLSKAIEMFAKYNLNIAAGPEEGGTVEQRRKGKIVFPRYYMHILDKAIERCRKDPKFFHLMYDLHEEYYSSYNYTYFLSQCAEGYGNMLKSYTLIDDFFHTIDRKNISKETCFNLLCTQLYCISTVGNQEDIQRVLDKTDTFFEENQDEIRNPQIRYAYYCNRSSALVTLGKLDTLIEMYEKREDESHDNTILYNIGEAYLRKQQFDDAVRIGKAACFLKADEQDYMLLAKAHMGLKEYEQAIEYLEKGIAYLKKEPRLGEESYRFRGMDIEPVNANDQNEQLAEFFATLIQAFVGNDDIKGAIAVKQIAEEDENINTLKESLDSTIIFQIENSLHEDLSSVKEEKSLIEEKLHTANNRISAFGNSISKWYRELVNIQILDAGEEVTDADWEMRYQEAFDKIIKNVSNYCVNTRSRQNLEIQNGIQKKFPQLPEKARNFLSTAERMYVSFYEEKTIDFAPVMVEYCRTIEVLLKEYLEKSIIYAGAYENAKAHNNQGATFGAATYAIKAVSGPLSRYHRDLDSIRRARNDSAHINVSREPEVTRVREFIWNSPLIGILCKGI